MLAVEEQESSAVEVGERTDDVLRGRSLFQERSRGTQDQSPEERLPADEREDRLVAEAVAERRPPAELEDGSRQADRSRAGRVVEQPERDMAAVARADGRKMRDT